MNIALINLIYGLAAIGAICFGYWAAPWLPENLGWENGPLENTQVFILLAGCLFAIWAGYKEKKTQIRWFWCLSAAFWLILVARELSWGAVFMEPLEILISGEPVYSASKQLWYYKATRLILAAVLMGLVLISIHTRQFDVVKNLWQSRLFPIVEIVIVVASMLIAAAAESKLGLSLSRLAAAGAQVFEEWAETVAYVFMFARQQRIWHGWGVIPENPEWCLEVVNKLGDNATRKACQTAADASVETPH